MEKQLSFAALIPDKNRTWTRQHFNTEDPTMEQLGEGYIAGGNRCKEVITVARDSMIDIIALWGMSDDNITKRPVNERGVLYATFEHFLTDLRDTWMNLPENRNVRFAHMGRRDRLEPEAPKVIRLIDDITADTRTRTGMVVAVCLDYGGAEERRRAMKLWIDAGMPGDPVDGWHEYLDLPKQGIPWRPVNMIVRTGQKPGDPVYDNEYLQSYRKETRIFPSELYLPDYTGQHFAEHVAAFYKSKQNRGA